MSHVELHRLRRAYGEVVVIEDVSVSIERGEFIAFLGPSGCGKTTTLRVVAGLDQPTAGEVVIEGRVVSAPDRSIFVPPEERRLGMVFQSYALWPHMSVEANVSYPLVVRGEPAQAARKAARRWLGQVGLEELAGRRVHELSGGQQQRVALARALVMEPAVLLLDEPLSNLDASLREQMRFEIKDLQKKLGITVIFVTHDQSEAFAMSDRIMVMHRGRIVQEGPPEEIYRHPVDGFVAGFLGVANRAPAVRDGSGQIVLEKAPTVAIRVDLTRIGTLPGKARLVVVVRPEAIDLVAPGRGGIPATVERVTFLGDRIDYRVRWADTTWRVSRQPPVEFMAGAQVELIVREGWALTDDELPLTKR